MKSPFMRPAPAVVLLLALLSLTASAQIARVNLPQSFPVIQTGNQIWIGTPNGLYQYNQNDDSFKRYAPPNSRPNAPVRYIAVYKEWLWCVFDTGLAALQIRLNDWLSFDSTNGLPSSIVTGIDFQQDEVWVSTPNGAARFDLLIEQWETFDRKRGLPDPFVGDIRSDGTDLWMISGNRLAEYSPQFEKWRTFDSGGDSVNAARRLFFFGDDLWIVTDRGLSRFTPKLQQRQDFFLPYLASPRLREIYIEGDRIWAITREGAYFYEQQSGVWTDFAGNVALRDAQPSFGFVTPNQVWVLTGSGTMVWDRDQQTWETLGYSSGLSLASYDGVSSDGELTFLFTPQLLEYRKTRQDPWRRFSLDASGPGGAGRNLLGGLFDNPDGGSVQAGPYLWNWQGTRISLLREYGLQMNNETITTQSSAWRFDVKSQLELGAGRRATGFYNNVDYSETKYGARFRGNDSDYVREITWGDFRREAGSAPFGQGAELFGSSIWLQAGPKTERFKRSVVTVKATSGEVRSQKTYEHFTGASTAFASALRDRDFAQDQFFSLPGVDSTTRPDGLEVYVDDMNAPDNTLRTQARTTIAGITGDFDAWIPVEEFAFSPRTGAVRLLKQAMPGWTVVARYRSGNRTVESVLQSGTISTARENIYFLGAQQIMPSSFAFAIHDSSGGTRPLTDFGLDDGSGRVDARWVDYNEGILIFPSTRPFPPEVYDPLNAGSRYTLEARGETQRPILQLRFRNLVRGSETLRLDDIPAETGNDFVLDYTNGTLIFVREGIVNPDTRIEIEYEYYASTGNQLAAAGMNVATSDNFFVQADWQKLSQDSTHQLSLFSEMRQQVGAFDVRLIPGVTYQTNEQKVTASSAEGLVSSSALRLQSKYERYAAEYRNIHPNQSIVGDVRDRLNLFGSLDIREDLRFTGEWKQTKGFVADSANPAPGSPTDKTGYMSLLFHGSDLPAAQVTYQSGVTHLGDSTTTKRFVQSLVEYQVPRAWASALRLQGLKAEYFLRFGRQSDDAGSGLFRQNFLQTYYRLNALVSEQFQTGFFYRKSTLHDATAGGTARPITSSDRLLGDVAFGEWRVMQINARVENVLEQDFHRGDSSLTYYLRQFHQVNTRLSPGQIWDRLSSLFFEVTYNQSVTQSDVASTRSAPSVWRITAPCGGGTGSYLLSRNTFVKNEFRPGTDWLISTLLEWNLQQAGLGISRLGRSSWQYTEKLDVRPGYTTRMIAQYRRFSQDQGFDRTTNSHEPSLWVEQRWTPDFLTTAQALYRVTGTEDRTTSGKLHDWEGMLDFVLRKDQWIGIRHVEFTQDFSGSRQSQNGTPVQRNYRLGATSSLDLYPFSSLIVRLRFDYTTFVDQVFDTGSYSTVDYTLKLSLQL